MLDSMYSPQVRRQAVSLLDSGISYIEVSRRMGINRSTLRDWTRDRSLIDKYLDTDLCPRCKPVPQPPTKAYAYSYLLGLYLGDGCLTPAGDPAKGVWRLRIACSIPGPGSSTHAWRPWLRSDRITWSPGSLRPVARTYTAIGSTGRAFFLSTVRARNTTDSSSWSPGNKPWSRNTQKSSSGVSSTPTAAVRTIASGRGTGKATTSIRVTTSPTRRRTSSKSSLMRWTGWESPGRFTSARRNPITGIPTSCPSLVRKLSQPWNVSSAPSTEPTGRPRNRTRPVSDGPRRHTSNDPGMVVSRGVRSTGP